jgi:hypothetical protein
LIIRLLQKPIVQLILHYERIRKRNPMISPMTRVLRLSNILNNAVTWSRNRTSENQSRPEHVDRGQNRVHLAQTRQTILERLLVIGARSWNHCKQSHEPQWHSGSPRSAFRSHVRLKSSRATSLISWHVICKFYNSMGNLRRISKWVAWVQCWYLFASKQSSTYVSPRQCSNIEGRILR